MYRKSFFIRIDLLIIKFKLIRLILINQFSPILHTSITLKEEHSLLTGPQIIMVETNFFKFQPEFSVRSMTKKFGCECMANI